MIRGSERAPWLQSLCRVVEERTGIYLEDAIPDYVVSVLEKMIGERARALGMPDRQAYCEKLRGLEHNSPEWSHVIPTITNGRTCFFRYPAQFEAFRKLARERYATESRPVSVWCAACSTGEEPYSLAMASAEEAVPVTIRATDLDPVSLATADAGAYETWLLRNMDSELVARYFQVQHGKHVVRRERMPKIRFAQHNLLSDKPPLPKNPARKWDFIFLRNACLYFRKATITRIIEQIVESLDPEGILFLGASESTVGLTVPLVPVLMGTVVLYRHPSTSTRAESSFFPSSALLATPRTSRLYPSPELAQATPAPTAPRTYMSVRNQVLRLVREGDVDGARVVLETLVKENPDDVIAHLSHGHLCLRMHRFDEALAAYESAQLLDPLLPEVYYFQAVAQRKLRRWPQAIQLCHKVLFLEPTFWPASFSLSVIFERVSKRADSRREMRRTVELLQGDKERLDLASDPLLVAPYIPGRQQVLAMNETLMAADARWP